MTKLVCCIQDNIYLNWQAELLAWNCSQLGLELHILSGFRGTPSSYAVKLEKALPSYISIEDTRKYRGYAPSIQPHLLKYASGQNLVGDGRVMILDSDVYLVSAGFLAELPAGDGVVYGSNVDDYIGAAYIDGTDSNILDLMCLAVGIQPDLVRSPSVGVAVGAQYVMPSIGTCDFWDKVERDSVVLHTMLNGYKCSSHQIQTWTASMWAILWNMYLSGYTVKASRVLDFAWPSNPISALDQRSILHMSGVTRADTFLFKKSDYTKVPPFWDKLNDSTGACSDVYAKAIKEYSRTSQCSSIHKPAY